MPDLTTADRLAIADTLARYSHCVDRGRWEELVELFTPDCRLDLSQVLGCYDGHDGLRQFRDLLAPMKLFMRHLVTNVIVHGDGEQARAESYVIAITGSPTARPATGLYDDELRKVEGRWLLHRRRLSLDVADQP